MMHACCALDMRGVVDAVAVDTPMLQSVMEAQERVDFPCPKIQLASWSILRRIGMGCCTDCANAMCCIPTTHTQCFQPSSTVRHPINACVCSLLCICSENGVFGACVQAGSSMLDLREVESKVVGCGVEYCSEMTSGMHGRGQVFANKHAAAAKVTPRNYCVCYGCAIVSLYTEGCVRHVALVGYCFESLSPFHHDNSGGGVVYPNSSPEYYSELLCRSTMCNLYVHVDPLRHFPHKEVISSVDENPFVMTNINY